MAAAREEASRLGHGHVGTEHLLLGLLRQRGSHAAEALDASGVYLEPCRQKVSEALASRVTSPAPGVGSQLPFTDRASRALDRASRLALRMGRGCRPLRSNPSQRAGRGGDGRQVLRGLSSRPHGGEGRACPAEAARAPAPSRDQTPAEALPPAGDSQPAASKGFAEPACRGCGGALRDSLEQVELPVGSVEQASVPKVKVVFCARCGTAVGVVSSGGL